MKLTQVVRELEDTIRLNEARIAALEEGLRQALNWARGMQTYNPGLHKRLSALLDEGRPHAKV